MKWKLHGGEQTWKLICHSNKRTIHLQASVQTKKKWLRAYAGAKFWECKYSGNQWERSVISLRFVYAGISWCHLWDTSCPLLLIPQRGCRTPLRRETCVLTFVIRRWSEKGFLSTVFQLLSLIIIFRHNLAWHILISLITPGRSHLTTVEVGKIFTGSQTAENIKNSQGIWRDCMNVEEFSSKHQILHYLRELTHMQNPLNVMEVGMISPRNHTLRTSENSQGSNHKDDECTGRYKSRSRKGCRTQNRDHNLLSWRT